MKIAIILYGPKGSGKSRIAQMLAQRLGVHHVDPDTLILELLAHGVEPDPVDGWLTEVHRHVLTAFERHDVASVEATGAWDSDWRLADDLQRDGAAVVCTWVPASLEETLRRLRARDQKRVEIGEQEVRRIFTAANERAAAHPFELRIDTDAGADDTEIAVTVAAAIAQKRRTR